MTKNKLNKNEKNELINNKKNVNNQSKKKGNKKIINEVQQDDIEILKTATDKRNIIITFILGFVIGLIIMSLFIPDRIATLEDGEQVIVEINNKTISADQLYSDMKKNYSITLLINKIDDIILTDLYPEDNDMKTSINETADYYISMYETYYGYTEEQFLEANGFTSRDEFIDYLKLDYRRNKYYEEYVRNLITDKEINSYYNDNVYGDISTKYISVDASEDEKTATTLVNKIITELQNGNTYGQLIEKYKDSITYEDLGYISFDNELSTNYINALKNLDDNSFTTDAVKEDDSYIIIFRNDQKEKPTLDEVKEKITDILAYNKQSEDQTLFYKALDKLRKDNNMIITDTDLNKKYSEYIKSNTEIEENTNNDAQ